MFIAGDTISIEVTSDLNKSTIATLVLERGIGDMDLAYEIQSASAVRHPDDKFDYEVSYLLAVGRALQSLGRKLEKRGNGLCKHQDDMKTYKKEQLKKKPQKARKK